MPTLIHRLTSPGDFTSSAVVCGDPHAQAATWDPRRVTCPRCTKAARRARPADWGMTEKALHAALTAALTRAGWLWFHAHDSRHSPAGYPDLTALRGNRCLVLELKSATGLLTPEQQTWLAAWRRILGVEVQVWRPADLEQALEVLR